MDTKFKTRIRSDFSKQEEMGESVSTLSIMVPPTANSLTQAFYFYSYFLPFSNQWSLLNCKLSHANMCYDHF